MKLTGFEGNAAFVTGAAGGIGLALVKGLRDAGAKVFATDTAKGLANLPEQNDPGTYWQALDIRDAEGVAQSVAQAEEMFGPVSLAVHAAGVLSTVPLLDLTSEEWERVIGINTTGTFNVLQSLGRVMSVRSKGAMVVVSSNAATIPRMNMSAYATSKAAATMLTRCVGLDLAAKGVRCNIVAPGSTLTPMQTGMWADENGAESVIQGNLEIFKSGIPLGKLATPEDIAAAAIFLLSDQAGQITMTDLYVDGGATLRG